MCKANSGWGLPAACNLNKGLSSDDWMKNTMRCRQCCGYWFLTISTLLPCPKSVLMVPPLGVWTPGGDHFGSLEVDRHFSKNQGSLGLLPKFLLGNYWVPFWIPGILVIPPALVSVIWCVAMLLIHSFPDAIASLCLRNCLGLQSKMQP